MLPAVHHTAFPETPSLQESTHPDTGLFQLCQVVSPCKKALPQNIHSPVGAITAIFVILKQLPKVTEANAFTFLSWLFTAFSLIK